MSAAAETIAAPATAPGRGGVGIIRISGPAAAQIGRAILGALPPPRLASVAAFRDADGATLDVGLALWFPGPASYTGEDVLELQGHGGSVVMDQLLQRALNLGARLARPGEFTERAFLNDKLDLAQAEAIADLVDAGSRQAAQAALRSLSGEFSAAVRDLAGQVLGLRTFVEAAIDFPDEDVEFLASAEVAARIDGIRAGFTRIGLAASQGRVLREGLTVVIAGRPNAGKSSLLNALAGHEAAIVTEIPGTTRDLLREDIVVDGLPVHVIDTAGLRDTTDRIEGEGVRRAQAELARADHALYLVDASQPWDAGELRPLPAGLPVTLVLNKIDVAPAGELDALPDGVPVTRISALTGAGLDELREHLKALAGYQEAGTGAWSARRRHLDALERAQALFSAARERLAEGREFELVAEELRLAHRALGEITGEVASDDLLGEIFGSFCIGK